MGVSIIVDLEYHTSNLKDLPTIRFDSYNYYLKLIEDYKTELLNYEKKLLGKNKPLVKIDDVNTYLETVDSANINSKTLKQFQSLSETYKLEYQKLYQAQLKNFEFEKLLNELKNKTPKLEDKITNQNRITDYLLPDTGKLPTKKYVLNNLTNLKDSVEEIINGKEIASKVVKQRILGSLISNSDDYQRLVDLKVINDKGTLTWERLMTSSKKVELLELVKKRLTDKIKDINIIEFIAKNNIIYF